MDHMDKQHSRRRIQPLMPVSWCPTTPTTCRGMCADGPTCTFLHRLPTKHDEDTLARHTTQVWLELQLGRGFRGRNEGD